MTPFMLYQIKAGICIMLFTGFYFLFLRQETFYARNRIYLAISVILSAILPLIRLHILPATGKALLDSTAQDAYINTIPVLPPGAMANQTPIPEVVYTVVATLFLGHLFYQFIRLVIMIRKNGSIRLGRFSIITLPLKSHSFSFFNLIFIASPTPQEGENDQVLQHEMVHARQLHSLDILLIQLFKIFQWFNPFIYLTEKAMQETHEYLADEAVLEQNSDSGRYRLLLLTQVFGVQPGIFSLFNYSLIKNRLVMMTKQKSPHRRQLKYLLILPLIAVMLLLNCTNKEAEEALSDENEKIWIGNSSTSPEEANAGVDPSGSKTTVSEDEPSFVFVEKMAEFQGGSLETFRDWVQSNLEYPEVAIKNGIFGRVTIQFAVSSKGNVCDIKILRGVDPSLDQEAIRILESSPTWIPAEQGGKPVKQQFVMPVVFSLK